MSNPFEDLRQAVVVRPMNSPGPQGAEAPEMKIQYSNDGSLWHNDPVDTDRYLRFSTDNGVTWSEAIYFNNLAETLAWVDKARQWAENPENIPVEDDKFSALHHATKAARSEFNAEAAALDAAASAAEAFGAAAPAWDSETVYNYNDVVSFDNGHTYRCIGTNVIGVDHAPNINGVDDTVNWTRITVAPDGYFEVDENGDLMPMITPITSEIFMLDGNGDITYQEDIDLEPWGGIELYGKIEFVDSITDLRSSSFYGTTEYVYVIGYYGAGTPGGGMFYKDIESSETDNSGTIIIDADGVRWKRANVHEEYYASWFGVSTDIDDNSPLIQNALNNIPNGSILIFGPGTYKCEQTIIIPDREDSTPYYPTVKRLTLQGSAKLTTNTPQSKLEYTGPDPTTLIPFIDFRGSTGDRSFDGSIRSMRFGGASGTPNIVGLWFYKCDGILLDNVETISCYCGIQIENGYWYAKFNGIHCRYSVYGFRAIRWANGAVFNYCLFHHNSEVGLACNLSMSSDSGINLNNCYFECNKIGIRAGVIHSIKINGCHFENFDECALEVLCTQNNMTPLIILNNSFINTDTTDVIENRAIIKQNINSSNVASYDLRNNSIREFHEADNTIDYFIYVENGNVVIKAENNMLKRPTTRSTPICSVAPLDSSYFNNKNIIT